MNEQIETNEPEEIRAGDSVTWSRSLSAYPASEGWVLSYAFRGPGVADFQAVPSGDDHLVDLTSEETALPAGVYAVQGSVKKGSTRKTIFVGRITLLEDLAATGAEYDPRTYAERTLEAIEAVLAGTATRSQKKQKHDDTELEYFTLGELLAARATLRREVRREREKADRKAGKPSRRIVRTISRGR